jgi:hypothetical protein
MRVSDVVGSRNRASQPRASPANSPRNKDSSSECVVGQAPAGYRDSEHDPKRGECWPMILTKWQKWRTRKDSKPPNLRPGVHMDAHGLPGPCFSRLAEIGSIERDAGGGRCVPWNRRRFRPAGVIPRDRASRSRSGQRSSGNSMNPLMLARCLDPSGPCSQNNRQLRKANRQSGHEPLKIFQRTGMPGDGLGSEKVEIDIRPIAGFDDEPR